MNFEEAMKEMEGMVINLNELPFTAFEVWFEDQDFYTNMRFIHGDKLFDKDGDVYRVLPVQMTYLAWDYRKAQLNNMEACYIGIKKINDEQSAIIQGHFAARQDMQKRIDEYEKLTTSIRNEFNLWTDGREFADVIEAQIENLEALRGEL